MNYWPILIEYKGYENKLVKLNEMVRLKIGIIKMNFYIKTLIPML